MRYLHAESKVNHDNHMTVASQGPRKMNYLIRRQGTVTMSMTLSKSIVVQI